MREGVRETDETDTARTAHDGRAEGQLLHEREAEDGLVRVCGESDVPRIQSLRVHTLHRQPDRRSGHVVLRSRPPDNQEFGIAVNARTRGSPTTFGRVTGILLRLTRVTTRAIFVFRVVTYL